MSLLWTIGSRKYFKLMHVYCKEDTNLFKSISLKNEKIHPNMTKIMTLFFKAINFMQHAAQTE